ncbi:lysyl-tRNA synthetase [Streptococcus pneumoniae]|uniref:lysyl-tRNA synthetase n=1 Tax=Streptococcus pneumoniae TaxID=1313 RepID=UPI000A970DE1|nr:lysyl-tRNA synthetase [Streptococcus pneumoniae]
MDRTDEVSNYIYSKVELTWFEEIFEEYKTEKSKFDSYLDSSQALIFYSLQ